MGAWRSVMPARRVPTGIRSSGEHLLSQGGPGTVCRAGGPSVTHRRAAGFCLALGQKASAAAGQRVGAGGGLQVSRVIPALLPVRVGIG